ncbi:hypothetical protein RD792_008959 [Penstemon davidsonii]|uniref:Uncharacterized protein n=1 Tax=Penstemon davidsonii TaxID=160366 RepID=A0ABR0DAM2_9LAMI|nr:hypothetical protein RD792_008959 [Penstemon davidsonii]
MEVLSSSFLPKSLQLTKDSLVKFGKKPQTKTKSHYTSPKKTPNQWSLATIFKSFDDFICTSIDLPLRPSIDPKHVLTGNYSPVHELPPTACEVVEGFLPSCLDGAYIRNGSNPQFTPRGPYHLFDGDGMLHMIKISKGKATFCSRYVKTYKYTIEREIGYTIFPSPFSSFNGFAASMARSVLTVARILTRQFNPVSHGFGMANISLALIGGQLFALSESDLPYRIKTTSDGDIVTLGRHDFFSDKPFISMTAHPKIDFETGVAFAFRYHVIRPFLTFFRIDSNGKKQPDVPIFSMKSTSLVHDLGVTKNYVIFPDIQIVMDPLQIVKGKSPARVDMTKVPRIGIIPKYAKDESEMWWIEAPGFNMMHCFNAWEEEDEGIIVIVASNISAVEQALERVDMAEMMLEKITINVKEKTLQRHLLSSKILEMGCINPAYAGKKNR